jgi:2-dehydropantoate 2-reductase
MKIAVVGCGAVGSFYGAKLARSGHAVHFLLRSDYDVVRQHGLTILSPGGDFHVQPWCARDPGEIGVADLVLVALKTTANHRFAELLPALVGPGTRVLTLQNGLGNEEQLAELFSPEQVLGGLCFVCLNRLRSGVVRHLDHGDIVVGEFAGPPQVRTHELAAAFNRAGIVCRVSPDLAHAHWEKLCWNIPFNGLGVAAAGGYPAVLAGRWDAAQGLGRCLPTDELLRDPAWEELVRQLMGEVIGAARRLRFDVPAALADDMIRRTRTMGAYKASTLLDFEAGRPLELKSLFLEPLKRSKAAGFAAPRLSALCGVLRDLDGLRNG